MGFPRELRWKLALMHYTWYRHTNLAICFALVGWFSVCSGWLGVF